MKRLEYTGFATVTIIAAQILSGLMGIVSIILGVNRLAHEAFEGLTSIATGIVSLGVFFALARIQNLDDPPE
jgi:drug/metabolite transporter (DMT)-like permease